jgi:hypothetical protein
LRDVTMTLTALVTAKATRIAARGAFARSGCHA